jgi:hypothetical protein
MLPPVRSVCLVLLSLSPAALAVTLSPSGALYCPAGMWDSVAKVCRTGTTKSGRQGVTAEPYERPESHDRLTVVVHGQPLLVVFAAEGRAEILDERDELLSVVDTQGDELVAVWVGDFVGDSAPELGFETRAGAMWVVESLGR